MNRVNINLQLQGKNSYLVTFLDGHLYLSGLWLGLAPRMATKKTFFYKEIGLCAQNMIIILGLVVNIIGGTYMTIQCTCETSLQ